MQSKEPKLFNQSSDKNLAPAKKANDETRARDEIRLEVERLSDCAAQTLAEYGYSVEYTADASWINKEGQLAPHDRLEDLPGRAMQEPHKRLNAAIQTARVIPLLRALLQDSAPTWKFARILGVCSALFPDPKASDYTSRWKQSARAKAPRVDGLGKEIYRILHEMPTATEREVLKELEKRIGLGVIDAIVDGMIEWTDAHHPAGSTPISALKDRISRAKKYLKSR